MHERRALMLAGKSNTVSTRIRNGCQETDTELREMVTVRANVSSFSPYYHSSSPCSLSFLLEQHHNQRVPSSPSLSPFPSYGAISHRVQTARNNYSPSAAQVPELARESTSNSASGGNRVYSGSPLLRQILRVGRKRRYEAEGSSLLLTATTTTTTPSPIAQTSKRARLESPGMTVPNSVIIVERKPASKQRAGANGLEQVVPGLGSPLEVDRRERHSATPLTSRSDSNNSVCQRSLPQNKEGFKPLELFSGDEIFANHEE